VQPRVVAKVERDIAEILPEKRTVVLGRTALKTPILLVGAAPVRQNADRSAVFEAEPFEGIFGDGEMLAIGIETHRDCEGALPLFKHVADDPVGDGEISDPLPAEGHNKFMGGQGAVLDLIKQRVNPLYAGILIGSLRFFLSDGLIERKVFFISN